MKAAAKYLDTGGSLLYLGGNGMYRPTYLSSERAGGDTDLMQSESAQWDASQYPLYEGKPLFAARVDNLGGPGTGVGVTVKAGQRFVPANIPAGIVGPSGWNGPVMGTTTTWGASGWETDHWPSPVPVGIAELARDAVSINAETNLPDGAVIATYTTKSGGFVLGVGSLTFVGSLMVDPTLQAIVTNALAAALTK
jgi:hypothetical protein